MGKKTAGVIILVAILLLWEAVSRSGAVNSSLFPAPSQVAGAGWQLLLSGVIVNDIAVSMSRLLAGLIIGVVIGISVGLLTGRSKTAAGMLGSVIQFLRPLPPVAIIPLIIVWLGIGNGAKIFSIAFAVFFPVWINTHIGSKMIPKIYIWSGQLLTKSWRKKITGIIFPAALPFIIAGVRSAIALAFIMVFVSELAGASSGLGYRISITHLAYRIDQMIAVLALLGMLGAVTDYLFSAAVHRVFPWLKFKTL
jgi:NitT/TauT family transport system permease protein/sulfonate transport system permease protein